MLSKRFVKTVTVGAVFLGLFGMGAGVASADTSGPGSPSQTAQQPLDTGGRWANHSHATGAICQDRGVVCSGSMWYPDQIESERGQEGQGGTGQYVQMPDNTGAECNNPGVQCGSGAS